MAGEQVAYSFNVPDVSALTFWITFAVLFIISFFMGLYLFLFVLNFGKPMRKYLTARLKNMSARGGQQFGVNQIYEHENLKLHLARVLPGDTFQDLEDPRIEITPKSITSVNAVPTALLWDVTPELPETFKQLLKEVISRKYETIEDILTDLNDGIIKKEDVLLSVTGIDEKKKDSLIQKKYTWQDFLEIYAKIRNRNETTVTPNDVLYFKSKYLDEHPTKSITERTKNIELKRSADRVYQKYAFAIMAIVILGGMAMLAYKMLYMKGGT